MKTKKTWKEVAVVFTSPIRIGSERTTYITDAEYGFDSTDFGIVCVPKNNPAAPFLIPWGRIDHVPLAAVVKSSTARALPKKTRRPKR